MSRFTTIAALSVVCFISTVSTSFGQFSSSRSTSSSTSSSQSWGNSQGFGPNGYFQNSFNNQSGRSSFQQNQSINTPWGGSSSGRSFDSGFNRSSGQSSAYNPWNGNSSNNNWGRQDQFSNQNQFNNSWRW